VLIVEDEALMAELLGAVVGNEPDLQVAGVAGSVAELAAYRGQPPDVVLMDYRLPDGNGAVATSMVKARWPTTRVIMLSAMHDDETMLESIGAGADGYLGKDSSADDIVAAIRAARAGEILLPPQLIVEIARRVASGRGQVTGQHHIEPLTPRQRVILRELVDGRSSGEICARLDMSPNTLRTHTQHILARLGSHSKLEAVTVAIRHGLVESPRDAQRGDERPPGSAAPEHHREER